ncbi:NAD(P)-dependent dehydrogenase, short-chain alcohol dehydrogenase family [Geosmithia morbida]|uniref:NAD(P)-dependent dehydrogenase, short-chain alcohol dehydrogenase family n=1 Tax=Geosmithia morbida TaxID=1094350 RepID=A0A9P4YR99_9HYPO|nr:NAD(P)-dependent dehydrogenase, short-chain alcohol dehydrogenase family [Geosmithia morbida]KAF4121656.1 NAD(P)-dependent dehydrogenase, short-chain alcohol dehydrogenase family [Geosmithia morbida]
MSNTSNLSSQSLFDLSGKVALVTGGGSGIGLMAAQALAANGAKVYICGRTQEKLDRASDTHGQDAKGTLIPIQADITKKESIAALSDEIKSREKSLSILVNNAGIDGESFPVAESKSAEELKKNLFDDSRATFDDWTNVYRTNVAATYFTTTAMLPLLQASTDNHPGWSATVVNITSISGMVKTSQHHFEYNASKAAAVHLTRMLASEVADAGLKIRINGIAPGVFPSEMTTGGSDEKQKSEIEKQRYQDRIPARRPGKDEDLAQAMLFAASNQYVNGETIAVDGGYLLSAGR